MVTEWNSIEKERTTNMQVMKHIGRKRGDLYIYSHEVAKLVVNERTPNKGL